MDIDFYWDQFYIASMNNNHHQENHMNDLNTTSPNPHDWSNHCTHVVYALLVEGLTVEDLDVQIDNGITWVDLVDETADVVENYVRTLVQMDGNGFCLDLANETLWQVDWQEIAEELCLDYLDAHQDSTGD